MFFKLHFVEAEWHKTGHLFQSSQKIKGLLCLFSELADTFKVLSASFPTGF